ncbi:MAG: hypothetical protein IKE68_08610 [Solobacterium sp.]|nr:hypothetical protein [Solobacterium sp.]
MTAKTWKIYRIMLGLAVCLAALDWRLTTGYLLGAAGSLIHLKRVERYCDTVLAAGQATRKYSVLSFLSNYALMAAFLICAAVMPQVFNLFAAAIGLSAVKIALVAEALTDSNRKEGGNGTETAGGCVPDPVCDTDYSDSDISDFE